MRILGRFLSRGRYRRWAVGVAIVVMAASCADSDSDPEAASPTTASPTTAEPAATQPAPSSVPASSEPTASSSPTSSGATADPCTVQRSAEVSVHQLSSGGLTYEYQLTAPLGEVGTAMPLVLDFHGLGSNGTAEAAFTGYATLALSEGFAVAHPTGLPAPGDARNAWELAQFDIADRDDVQMAADLIDHVGESVCLDSRRVYATGLSNGGLFSSLLACRLADRVAATFSVGGISHPDGCEPSRPVAMGAVHGTADEVLPYRGGGSVLLTDDASDADVAFFDQVIPDEVGEFAADFGCQTLTEERIGNDTILFRHGQCEGNVEVVLFEVTGGGHTWPGSAVAVAYESLLGYATPDVHATLDGWRFMSQYQLAE